MVYNEISGGLVSFYPFHPKMYISDNSNIMTHTDSADLYIHDYGNFGEYYGIVYPSKIKFVVNDNANLNKVFGNIFINSQSVTPDTGVNHNQDTWDRMRLTNDYQNTDFFSLIYNVNLMRKERTWKIAIPRNRVLYNTSDSPDIYDPSEISTTRKQFGERMRDKYLQIELEYDNADNNLLKTAAVTTMFRESPR